MSAASGASESTADRRRESPPRVVAGVDVGGAPSGH